MEKINKSKADYAKLVHVSLFNLHVPCHYKATPQPEKLYRIKVLCAHNINLDYTSIFLLIRHTRDVGDMCYI